MLSYRQRKTPQLVRPRCIVQHQAASCCTALNVLSRAAIAPSELHILPINRQLHWNTELSLISGTPSTGPFWLLALLSERLLLVENRSSRLNILGQRLTIKSSET